MRKGENVIPVEERSPSLRWYHEKLEERRERGRKATAAWRKSERGKKWRSDNREHLLEQMADLALKRNYGISLGIYEEKLRQQKGGCQLCGKPPAKGKRLSVDHDHKTKTVRDLLCRVCNRGIAYLENPEWMQKALAYLEKHK